MEQSIYSVRELTREVKRHIEQHPRLKNVWVRAEISNFVHHRRGHMYFTLKDEHSRVKSVMFKGNNQFLKFVPQEGMSILARGEVNVYERDGQYQFYVKEMQPDGIGALYQAYEDLKQKLEERGWFDQGAKRPIPAIPQKIGVITSPSGAAVRDIITTVRRRFPIAQVCVIPVQVQGGEAAPSIVRAIALAHRHDLDLLIVGRGGGSIEELWAFNEEVVAEAIHSASIPVISAVGHETDFTIADFVADLRAPTPTAAAELAVPELEELSRSVTRHQERLSRAIRQFVQLQRDRLKYVRQRYAFRYPYRLLQQKEQQYDQMMEQLKKNMLQLLQQKRTDHRHQRRHLLSVHPQKKIEQSVSNHRRVKQELHKSMHHLLHQRKQALHLQAAKLDARSPLKIMNKGYSLVYDGEKQHLYQSAKQINPGQGIRVRMHDGELDCHVWGIKEETENEE